MKVEWIISLLLAALACYAWWELRKLRSKSLGQIVMDESKVDSSPLNERELTQFVLPIAKTVYMKQSPDCEIAEAVLGGTVAAMLARSQPEHVARFLHNCADSVERMSDPNKPLGRMIEGLYEKQRSNGAR